MCRPLTIQDVPTITRIHCETLAEGFLSALGPGFLEVLYTYLLDDAQVFGFVYEDVEVVHGFVIGCERIRQLFSRTLARHAWHLAIPIIRPLIRHPRLIGRVLQTILYPGKEPMPSVEVELIVIAIDPHHRGQGVGRTLVSFLNHAFLQRGIHTYKVTVLQSNEQANHFYRSLGCTHSGTFQLYGRDWNLYVAHLDPSAGVSTEH